MWEERLHIYSTPKVFNNFSNFGYKQSVIAGVILSQVSLQNSILPVGNAPSVDNLDRSFSITKEQNLLETQIPSLDRCLRPSIIASWMVITSCTDLGLHWVHQNMIRHPLPLWCSWISTLTNWTANSASSLRIIGINFLWKSCQDKPFQN